MMHLKFHHWGFADFIATMHRANPQQTIVLSISYDDSEEIYCLDIYEDSGQSVESFNYMREQEILDDIAQALTQLKLTIKMI
jgi:hypothetical protein